MTDEEKKKDWQDRELGALWKKTSKSGVAYYSGTIKINGESFELVCYGNTNKKADNHPDVRIYKATNNNGQD